MSGLGPDARSLVDAARGGDEPSDADAARVRAKIAGRIAMAAAAGTAATVAAKSAGAGAGAAGAGAGAGAAGAGAGAGVGAGASVGAKILLAVALVGGSAATSAVVLRSEAPTKTTIATTTTHTSAAPSEARRDEGNAAPIPAPTTATVDPSSINIPAPNAVENVAPAPAPSTVETAPSAPRAGIAIPTTPPRAHAKTIAAKGDVAANPAPVADTAAAPRADSVAEEAALLRSANAALAHGDGVVALSRLDEHAARFPHGALAEERQAARVFALCTSGRAADARAAASAFVAQSPRSPLVAQVRRSCATNNSP